MARSAGKEIWVYGDLRNRRLFRYSLNVLFRARELAAEISGRTAVVLLGWSGGSDRAGASPIETAMSLDAGAGEAIAHGADRVYTADQRALSWPRADLYAEALAEAIAAEKPMLVLFPLTDLGRDIAARTARLLDFGLIADCVDLRFENGAPVASCPAWGVGLSALLAFTDRTETGLATVQPHLFEAVEVADPRGELRPLRIREIQEPNAIRLLSCREAPEGRHKLQDAEVVVVGGAGLGSAEQFAELRQLAAALGGEIGATRPPVLEHWIDPERMIGQTGKTVRPGLLLSVGTSGAIQYTAGIVESGCIVAINRDRNAPIFSVADIGVVADIRSFLPRLITKVKQAVMREIADVLGEADSKTRARGSFGFKVRRLRESHGWTLERLAETTGQSPDFLVQVESDEIIPPVSFLLRLSQALKVDPGTFLKDEEKAALTDQRAQGFLKRTKNYYYRTLTPGAENEHLRAFMITIEPKQVHKSVEYKHAGEEFVFVMDGSLELTLDQRPHTLRQGESMHFNSETPHKLRSIGPEETRCLVVLYTP